MLTARVLWRRDSVLKSGAVRSSPASPGKLQTKPVVCPGVIPKSIFIVRHVRTAASPQDGCRPRLPVGSGSRQFSGSNRIVNEPRRLSASPYADRFGFLWLKGVGPLMHFCYHAGFKR